MLRIVLPLALLWSCFNASLSAQRFWAPVAESGIAAKGQRLIVPRAYQTFRVEVATLEGLLQKAPLQRDGASLKSKATIELPMPDGSSQRFSIMETPVMHPDLQAKYPQIRCYTGRAEGDPAVLLKCDFTPQGFHAMILKPGESTVFIDPYTMGDRENIVCYYKKDYERSNLPSQYSCGVETGKDESIVPANPNGAESFQGDCVKRRYRLALACTGEYAAFHGGTKPRVLAAMNTSINRINGVYEREINVNLQIIPKNDTLIFLNAASDPYTNNNGDVMLGENVQTCNARIGLANYDMGHVFSTGGGGIAEIGSVCSTIKAAGVTGGPSPVGDPFDIDYVAHEMGHQFGATHTQNNACGRTSISSMEPGSGSTLMSYAGICAPNVQNVADDYFHAVSLAQIGGFVTLGGGGVCGTRIVTGNSAPTVSAGFDYIIPRSTPFALTATASDPDGDALTYCWEQTDPEFATMPPAATNATGPLFRSIYPNNNPTRTFPRLQDLVANVNPTWEKLPNVARNMRFRVTVRDNKPGGGCTDEDDMIVAVASGAGPFVVTEPNTNVTWEVGTTQTVTWNVANTTAAPVNCGAVRIRLSTDGGFTYPIVLAGVAPNNGSATITVPDAVSATCRVRVEAYGNIFFDISNQNFRIISATTPTFLTTLTPLDNAVCVGNSATYNLAVSAVNGFNSTVTLSAVGLPAGSTVQIVPPQLTPPGNAVVTVSGLTNAMAGGYGFNIVAASSTTVRAASAVLSVFPSAPTAAPATIAPLDGVREQPINMILDWGPVGFAAAYYVEVATSPSFEQSTLVTARFAARDSIQGLVLEFGTPYYWRVRAVNNCGAGPFSPTYAFQTLGANCSIFEPTDVPLTITDAGPSTVTSTIAVPGNQMLEKAEVLVSIAHTWLGDLNARLTAPNGTTFTLFDRPGVPADPVGCGGENIVAIFNDDAALTAADLENTCNFSAQIAILGEYRPVQSLRPLKGQVGGGNWRLAVRDFETDDGGALVDWALGLCFSKPTPAGALLRNDTMVVIAGQSTLLDSTLLKVRLVGVDTEGVFTLLALPAHGNLLRNGQTLGIGGQFSQKDIKQGLVRYQHNGDNATSDSFLFDALDDNGDNWVHAAGFNIRIVRNNLAATATQTASIRCNGETTGQITVSVTGLNGQYRFSLNGGAPQTSGVFNNLPAGTYNVVVTGQFGFTTTAGPVVIGQPTALATSAAVTLRTVTITANGGTDPLSYSLDGATFQNGNTFNGVANGTYTVVVRDANGCTATATAAVSIPTFTSTASIQQTLRCNGDLNGAISATANGGIAPYEYALNGGTYQSNANFSNLGAGAYTVSARDAEGTIVSNTVTLVQPTALSLSASAVLRTVSINASGGTGTLSYSLDGANFQASNVFNDVANGTYTVTVRDANGCTKTTGITVDVAALGTSVTVAQTIPCAGQSNGALAATTGGGIPPYEYSLNNGVFQSSPQFTGLPAGNYTVVVRDAAGVTASSSIALSQPQSISATTNVVLRAIVVTATGGTGAFSYSLAGGAFQSDNTFANNPNGTYTITVRDANGCTATTNALVSIPALVGSAGASQNVSCNGGANGAIAINASGGIAPYTYALNGGTAQSSPNFNNLEAGTYEIVIRDAEGTLFTTNVVVSEPSAIAANASTDLRTITVVATGGTGTLSYSLDGNNFQASGVFNNTPNGSYTLVVRDANGCTATATASVSIPTLTGGATVTQPIACNGAATGAIAVNVTGGITPYTYAINGTPIAPPYSQLPAGNYTISIRDAEGTVITSNVTLSQPTAITTSATVALRAITVVASGGTGNLSYSLDGTSFQNNGTFSGVANGVYTVIVRDENGCTATTTASVNILALSGSTTAQPVRCNGDANGSIAVIAAGGIAPYAYALDNGAFQNNANFGNLAAGTYKISIRDSEGTIFETSATVTQPSALSLTSAVNLRRVTLTGTGGTGALTYSLNGSAFQSNGTFNNIPNGTYTAVVRDANGCTTTATATVAIPVLVCTAAIIRPIQCNGGNEGEIAVSASGGIPPYQYALNGGAFGNNNVFANLKAGNYTLSVRDAEGTVTPVNVTLAEPQRLIAQGIARNDTLEAIATGGTAPYTYALRLLPNTNIGLGPDPIFKDLKDGLYLLVVVDARNCTAADTIQIKTTGISEALSAWQIRVSPNPGPGFFQLEATQAPDALWANVFDLTGKRLWEGQLSATNGHLQAVLDLSQKPAGTYILQLTDGTRTAALRLVVTRR